MIAVIGTQFIGGRIVNALQEKNIDAVLIPQSALRGSELKRKLRSHLIVHFVSSPSASALGFITLIRCKMWHKKIVANWIGWDVLRVTTKPFWRIIAKLSQHMIDVNIATSSNLVNELKNIGIISKFQPIPVYSIYQIRVLPVDNKIAVYLPDQSDHHWNFYQGDVIKKLVNEFPKVEFIITGNSGKQFNQKNVKCIKWTENMEEIYSQVKGVIRLPLHDGTSGTVIEALSMGRNMITSSNELPYCKLANNFEEVKEHLSKIIENANLNTEGSKYIHANYNRSKLTDELISVYHSIK